MKRKIFLKFSSLPLDQHWPPWRKAKNPISIHLSLSAFSYLFARRHLIYPLPGVGSCHCDDRHAPLFSPFILPKISPRLRKFIRQDSNHFPMLTLKVQDQNKYPAAGLSQETLGHWISPQCCFWMIQET